jgi:hypothetical protein
MAEPVYVVDVSNEGAGIAILFAFAIASPALMPAFHLVGFVWDFLTQQNLHPMFKLLAEGVVIGAMGYALYLFFRFLPAVITITLTVLYLGYTYGVLVHGWGHDPIWSSGVAVVVGVFFFYVARTASEAAKA